MDKGELALRGREGRGGEKEEIFNKINHFVIFIFEIQKIQSPVILSTFLGKLSKGPRFNYHFFSFSLHVSCFILCLQIYQVLCVLKILLHPLSLFILFQASSFFSKVDSISKRNEHMHV